VIEGVENPIPVQKTALDLDFALKVAEPPDEHLGSDTLEEFVDPKTPAAVSKSLQPGPGRRKWLELPWKRKRLG
jgi:hypothetical protein